MRQISQRLSIPYPLDQPIEKKCEDLILALLKDAPSGWGVIKSNKLNSIKVGDSVTLETFGPSVFIKIDALAEYEIVGYREGDVLFNVDIGNQLEGMGKFSQFLDVNVLGIPFSIELESQYSPRSTNITIESYKLNITMTYIARPAFYPQFSPIVAGFCGPETKIRPKSEEPFYSRSAVVPKNRTLTERLLSDPYADVKDITKRIPFPIRETRLILGLTPLKGGEKDMAIGIRELFEGKSKELPTPKLTGRETIYEGLPLDMVMDRWKVLNAAANDGKIKSFDFVRPPTLPLVESKGKFVRSVLCAYTNRSFVPDRPNPGEFQIIEFIDAVDEYISMKEQEAESFRKIYSSDLLSDPSGKTKASESEEAKVLKAHLQSRESLIGALHPGALTGTTTTTTTTTTTKRTTKKDREMMPEHGIQSLTAPKPFVPNTDIAIASEPKTKTKGKFGRGRRNKTLE